MSSQDAQSAANDGLMAKLMGLYRQHETLLKYFFIGGMASAIDVVLYFILYNFVFPDTVQIGGLAMSDELAAQSISVPTAIVFSFVVNARHNFKTNDYALIRFISFCIVCLIGYLAGYWVILAVQDIMVQQFSMTEQLGGNIGKIVSLPVVFIIQYILNSKITFRKVSGATA